MTPTSDRSTPPGPPSAEGSSDGTDPLHEIRLRAWRRNRGRADELVEIVSAWAGRGGVPAAQLERARSVTHQLLGSAGTFGHDAVTQTLNRVQELLTDQLLSDEQRPDELSDLTGLIGEVHDLLQHEPPRDED